MLGTGFIHPPHPCLLVCATLTYDNSNTDEAHLSSQEVVKKKTFQSQESHMEERHYRKQAGAGEIIVWMVWKSFCCNNKRPIGIKKLLRALLPFLGLHLFVLLCTAKSGGWEGIFTASRTLSRLPLAFLAGRSCFLSFRCRGLHAREVKGQSRFWPVAVFRLDEVMDGF